jgi:hypothetical protein
MWRIFIALCVVSTTASAESVGVAASSQLPRFDITLVEPELFESLLRNTGVPAVVRTTSGASVVITPTAEDEIVVLPSIGSIKARVCLAPKHLEPNLTTLASNPIADAALGLPPSSPAQVHEHPRGVFSDTDESRLWDEFPRHQCYTEKIKDERPRVANRDEGTYQFCPEKHVRWIRQSSDKAVGGNLRDGIVEAVVFGRHHAAQSRLQPVGDHLIAVYPDGDACPHVNHAVAESETTYETTVYFRCRDGDIDDHPELRYSWQIRELAAQCRLVVTIYTDAVCEWARRTLDVSANVVPCTELDDSVVSGEFAADESHPPP